MLKKHQATYNSGLMLLLFNIKIKHGLNSHTLFLYYHFY